MNNLDQIIVKHGYKLSDFSECQIETFKMALENNLELKTIINPLVDEVVMNLVVYETITIPDKLSMLPYLFAGVTFAQLGDIRKAVEAGDEAKVSHFIELFQRDDFSNNRKSYIARLIEKGIEHKDFLNSPLNDEALILEIRERIPKMYDANSMFKRAV